MSKQDHVIELRKLIENLQKALNLVLITYPTTNIEICLDIPFIVKNSLPKSWRESENLLGKVMVLSENVIKSEDSKIFHAIITICQSKPINMRIEKHGSTPTT